MSERIYVVRADWDAEAKVWVAYSDDVPGLATGADTLEGLVEKLRVVVPELLEEMGLHDRQAAASIRLRARAMPANQPWISALLRGSSDRFPVLSSA